MNDASEFYTSQTYAPPVHFKLTRFNEFKLDDHDPYIVKGLLPAEGLIVVWGPPKCGKSFWVFDLLMHVALGREYRGLRIKQGTIVYCALEGVSGFKKRIAAFQKEKLEPKDDPPFHLMTTRLTLVREAEALVADIKAQLGGARPAVIAIDTLNRSFAGSESPTKT
jgi:RecA-family ATPase